MVKSSESMSCEAQLKGLGSAARRGEGWGGGVEGGMIPAFKGLKGCHTEERLRLFRLAPGLSFEVFKQRKNDHLLSTWGMPSGVGSRGPPKSQLGCSLILMLPPS